MILMHIKSGQYTTIQALLLSNSPAIITKVTPFINTL